MKISLEVNLVDFNVLIFEMRPKKNVYLQIKKK